MKKITILLIITFLLANICTTTTKAQSSEYATVYIYVAPKSSKMKAKVFIDDNEIGTVNGNTKITYKYYAEGAVDIALGLLTLNPQNAGTYHWQKQSPVIINLKKGEVYHFYVPAMFSNLKEIDQAKADKSYTNLDYTNELVIEGKKDEVLSKIETPKGKYKAYDPNEAEETINSPNTNTNTRSANNTNQNWKPTIHPDAKYLMIDKFGEFSEGLCIVIRGNKAGFIDTLGNFVIPIENNFQWYVDINSKFINGKCQVSYNNNTAYINKKGEIVSAPSNRLEGFYEGLKAVNKTDEYGQNKWGFVDREGNTVIDFMFSNRPGYFKEGLAVVIDKEGKVGFIDKKGDLVIDTKYGYSYKMTEKNYFHEGYAIVYVGGGGTMYIDKNDSPLILPEKVGPYSYFSEGLAVVLNVTNSFYYGFVNKKGEIEIPLVFRNQPTPFHNGLSLVYYTDRETNKVIYGFMNKKGEFVIVKKESKF